MYGEKKSHIEFVKTVWKDRIKRMKEERSFALRWRKWFKKDKTK